MGPKAPPYVIKEEVPVLLDSLLDEFLPQGLGLEQRNSEKDIIEKFIVDFNQIRKYHLQRDFTDSQVFHNISLLYVKFPFVSKTLNYISCIHKMYDFSKFIFNLLYCCFYFNS